MPVAVGVDAGGTSTRALATYNGAEGVVAVEGGANLRRGVDAAVGTIERAIVRALDGRNADALHVGIAGGGSERACAALEAALLSQFPGVRISISDDATIALRAGAPEGDAIAIIAGTGSIAYAEVEGARYRAGGFGYLVGDEGSGRAIGAAALNLMLRSYDGRGPREPLFDRIEELLLANDRQTILERIYCDPEPVTTLALLAPLVLSGATAGERSATKLVQQAALELFELLRTVVKLANIGSRELPLVLSGGLLSENSLLTYLLETRISNEFPHLVVRKGSKPVDGALSLARSAIAQ